MRCRRQRNRSGDRGSLAGHHPSADRPRRRHDEAVTLVVETKHGALLYQWQKDGFDIPGAIESTYTLDPVLPLDQGEYVVIVSNDCGDVPSDPITLALVEPPRTTRVSVDSLGRQANDGSGGGGMSADGRFVVINSAANLAGGFDDDFSNAFVHDRQTATTIQVDMNPDGPNANNDSAVAVMSKGERWVAIESRASNLVSGDTNDARDIFLVRTTTRKVVRISVNELGEQGNGDSSAPSISDVGRYIAFQSDADNLVAGDGNGASDVFVYNRESETTVRVSLSSLGVEGSGPSRAPRISDDGRYVVFESEADNLVAGDANGAADVFVHDRDPDGNGVFDEGNGTTVAVSLNSAGELGNGHSLSPSFSADGMLIAFASEGTNLDPDDVFSAPDAYIHDQFSGQTYLAARKSDGTAINNVTGPVISGDGRVIAFASGVGNIVPGDTNGVADVFVRDLAAGQVSRVSINAHGGQADRDCLQPSISSNGGLAAFESRAGTLILDQDNRGQNIFLHQRAECNDARWEEGPATCSRRQPTAPRSAPWPAATPRQSINGARTASISAARPIARSRSTGFGPKTKASTMSSRPTSSAQSSAIRPA